MDRSMGLPTDWRHIDKRVWRPTIIASAAVAAVVILGLRSESLELLLLGLLVIGMAFILRGSFLRAGIITFGSILLFQSDAVPFVLKAAFLALAVLLATQSIAVVIRMRKHMPDRLRSAAKFVHISAAGIAVLLIAQLVFVIWTQVPLDVWFRDALNYLMLPIAMVIGLEAGLSLPIKSLSFLAISVGFLGAASVLTAWLQRRGGSELGFEQFGLASSFTVFVSLALCLASYFGPARARAGWLVLALVQMGMIVATGGRQPVVFSVLALGLAVLLGGGTWLRRLWRAGSALILVVLSYFAVIEFSTRYGGGIAVGRLQFFDRISQEGISAIASDGSAIDRSNAYNWVLEIWAQSPILGQGLGHYLPAVRTGVVTEGVLTLDTPLVVFAKFGLLGTIVLVGSLVLVFAAIWPGRLSPDAAPMARLYWFLGVALTLATIPNGFPTENRGFPIFLVLFISVGIGLLSYGTSDRMSSRNLRLGRRTQLAPTSNG